MLTLPTIPAGCDGAVFVYMDRRPCGAPFYVGIGRADRVRTTRRYRNRHHEAIVRKYDGCRREILCVVPDNDTAAEIERRLIAHYGRTSEGGPLVNRSAGGDGYSDPPQDAREARRKAMTGKRWTNRPGANAAAVAVARVVNIGNTHTLGLKLSEEARAKISATHKGRPKSPEMRAKLAQARRERSARVAEFLRATGADVRPLKVTNAMLAAWEGKPWPR